MNEHFAIIFLLLLVFTLFWCIFHLSVRFVHHFRLSVFDKWSSSVTRCACDSNTLIFLFEQNWLRDKNNFTNIFFFFGSFWIYRSFFFSLFSFAVLALVLPHMSIYSIFFTHFSSVVNFSNHHSVEMVEYEWKNDSISKQSIYFRFG